MSKGIKFRRNNKSQLIDIQIAEIVYALDTNEWGLGTSTGTIWRKHFTEFKNTLLSGNGVPNVNIGEVGFLYVDLTDENGIYIKESNGWKYETFRYSRAYINANFLAKGLITDYSSTSRLFSIDSVQSETIDTYIPSAPLDVINKKYLDTYKNLRDDGTTQMVPGYIPQTDLQVVTKGNLSDVNFVPPTVYPETVGTLWNENGVPKLSTGPRGIIRYYTSAASLNFSILGTITSTNGYVDIESNDNPILQNNKTLITKIEVIKFGNRTSWEHLAHDCDLMTQFVVSATDTCNVANFGYAWACCPSLLSFPSLDVSKGTNFIAAWAYCEGLTSFPSLDVGKGTAFVAAWQSCTSLTSFPLLDTSKGTDFSEAWSGCSSLTSFPSLNVSSGTDFGWAWENCTSLPHCPGGNEVTIPVGAITTDMCLGI